MRRTLVEPDHPQLRIRRQCELLDLNRAAYYYVPATESPLNLALMRLIYEPASARSGWAVKIVRR